MARSLSEIRADLETEAERLKERADRLDRYLQGHQEWLEVLERMPPTVAEVTVDKALAEARQTALALTTIARTLASLGAEQDAQQSGGDPLDEMARRRAEKLAQAAGQG